MIDQLAEQFTGYEEAVKNAMPKVKAKIASIYVRQKIENKRIVGGDESCTPEKGEFLIEDKVRTLADALGFDITGPETRLRGMKDHPQFPVTYTLKAEIRYWYRPDGTVDYIVRIFADITITPRPGVGGEQIQFTDTLYLHTQNYNTKELVR